MAYGLGRSLNRNKRYGLTKTHSIVSITIGELIFFIIISFIIFPAANNIFWYVMISFVLYYSLSLISYLLGSKNKYITNI